MTCPVMPACSIVSPLRAGRRHSCPYGLARVHGVPVFRLAAQTLRVPRARPTLCDAGGPGWVRAVCVCAIAPRSGLCAMLWHGDVVGVCLWREGSPTADLKRTGAHRQSESCSRARLRPGGAGSSLPEARYTHARAGRGAEEGRVAPAGRPAAGVTARHAHANAHREPQSTATIEARRAIGAGHRAAGP